MANVNETMKINNKDEHSYISINDNVRTRRIEEASKFKIIIHVPYI